jgi:hypothetical protein
LVKGGVVNLVFVEKRLRVKFKEKSEKNHVPRYLPRSAREPRV